MAGISTASAPLFPSEAAGPGQVDRRRLLALGAGVMAFAGLGGAAFAAPKTRPIKVAAIYTVPVEQHWVSRIHRALKAAEARDDITYKFSENVAGTDYEGVMRQYSQEGADLVVGEIFAVERPARKVMLDYPGTAYLMGSSFGPTKPNLAVFDNFIHEPCFLAGMVAGKTTKSGIIGLVGGHAIPEANRLMQAVMEGALSVNPNVKFLVTFIDSRNDPAKAREAALAQIDKGADVLFAERVGVADAAKERGVKAIGNIVDGSGQYPGTIVASALWQMEPTIDKAIREVAAGSFAAADYSPYSYMAEGGASLAPLDPKLVPPEVIELVLAKEREIRDGLFRVNLNDTAPRPTM